MWAWFCCELDLEEAWRAWLMWAGCCEPEPEEVWREGGLVEWWGEVAVLLCRYWG